MASAFTGRVEDVSTRSRRLGGKTDDGWPVRTSSRRSRRDDVSPLPDEAIYAMRSSDFGWRVSRDLDQGRLRGASRLCASA